jgi:hypothetical protein
MHIPRGDVPILDSIYRLALRSSLFGAAYNGLTRTRCWCNLEACLCRFLNSLVRSISSATPNRR